jgi:AcrR family transcriptional regulator
MTKVDLPPFDTTQIAATRDRILDSAEFLFAEHGVDSTSVRMITELAKVNVAAINYHFGTKDNMVLEVIARRYEALEGVRMAALEEIEARAARENRPPTAYELVEAAIGPVVTRVLSGDPGWTHFIHFISRLESDPGAPLRPPPSSSTRVLQRFDEALCRAVPHLAGDRAKRVWRIAFMRGAAQHTLLMIAAIHAGRLAEDTQFGVLAESTDLETVRRDLITFVAAGLAT